MMIRVACSSSLNVYVENTTNSYVLKCLNFFSFHFFLVYLRFLKILTAFFYGTMKRILTREKITERKKNKDFRVKV